MNSFGLRILSITSTKSWATRGFSKNTCSPITRACFQKGSQRTGSVESSGCPRRGSLIFRNCCRILVNTRGNSACDALLCCCGPDWCDMQIFALHQTRLRCLLPTAMQRSTTQTPSKSYLSKSSSTTGGNTSRMATHRRKDVFILKTGTCQGAADHTSREVKL